MTNDELKNKIEQVSATMGLDFEDEELTEFEKEALLHYVQGNIGEEELISIFKKGQTK